MASRRITPVSLKRVLFPGLWFFRWRGRRRANEVWGKQILWAASERACQLFDEVNASAEVLRDDALDLRES